MCAIMIASSEEIVCLMHNLFVLKARCSLFIQLKESVSAGGCLFSREHQLSSNCTLIITIINGHIVLALD